MQTSIIILSIVLIIALFCGLKQFKRDNEQKTLSVFRKALKKIIRENKFLMYYKDDFHKKLIGLDRKNNKLLLLDFNKNKKLLFCLGIKDIKKCSLIQMKDNSNVLKNVFLEITSRDNGTPIKFSFYDKESDDKNERTCLVLKARDWNERINFHKNYWWLNSGELHCN